MNQLKIKKIIEENFNNGVSPFDTYKEIESIVLNETKYKEYNPEELKKIFKSLKGVFSKNEIHEYLKQVGYFLFYPYK